MDGRAKQIKLLKNSLESCGSDTGKKKKKTKRAMSGYNCYMKKCASKPGKNFPTCLTEKGWAKLSATEKAKYNKLAKAGC